MQVTQFLLDSWNGPFYLGPLTKPISNNEALMKILEVIWKIGLVALFCYFLFGIFVIFAIYVLGL